MRILPIPHVFMFGLVAVSCQCGNSSAVNSPACLVSFILGRLPVAAEKVKTTRESRSEAWMQAEMESRQRRDSGVRYRQVIGVREWLRSLTRFE